MAELALVASIAGVASLGIELVKSLYQTGDILVNAHKQIKSIARRVNQFTRILKHLGSVLQAERGLCSEDLLKEVSLIIEICKLTFKEIDTTLRSKRFPSLQSVRWVFKKSKAAELEARLVSEQSMLQVMIQTVTVSKIGRVQARSQDSTQCILDLKEEISVLKTSIVENYDNVKILQRSESRSESPGHVPAEDSVLTKEQMLHVDRDFEGQPLKSDIVVRGKHLDPPPSYTSNSDLGEKSGNVIREDRIPNPTDHVEEPPVTSDDPGRALTPRRNVDHAHHEDRVLVSVSLLHMIPYQPKPNIMQANKPTHMISDKVDDQEDPPILAMRDTTQTVRSLLDKWTIPGSAPLADSLEESAAEEKMRENIIGKDLLDDRKDLPDPLSSSSDESSGSHVPHRQKHRRRDSHERKRFPPPDPEPLSGQTPKGLIKLNLDSEAVNAVWAPMGSSHPARREVADRMMKALKDRGGNLMYQKGNDYQHVYFTGDKPFYQYVLVPDQLLSQYDAKFTYTIVPTGLIHKPALTLMGYTYDKLSLGDLTITGDLTLSEIEELVVLSYQSESHDVEDWSNEIIEERGWRSQVDALKRGEQPDIPVSQRYQQTSRQPPASPQTSGQIMLDRDSKSLGRENRQSRERLRPDIYYRSEDYLSREKSNDAIRERPPTYFRTKNQSDRTTSWIFKQRAKSPKSQVARELSKPSKHRDRPGTRKDDARAREVDDNNAGTGMEDQLSPVEYINVLKARIAEMEKAEQKKDQARSGQRIKVGWVSESNSESDSESGSDRARREIVVD